MAPYSASPQETDSVIVDVSSTVGAEDEGEGPDTDGGASRVTMSYQSTREVATEARDTRATVDIDAETDVRVMLVTGSIFCLSLMIVLSGAERRESKVSINKGCGLGCGHGCGQQLCRVSCAGSSVPSVHRPICVALYDGTTNLTYVKTTKRLATVGSEVRSVNSGTFSLRHPDQTLMTPVVTYRRQCLYVCCSIVYTSMCKRTHACVHLLMSALLLQIVASSSTIVGTTRAGGSWTESSRNLALSERVGGSHDYHTTVV